MFTVQTLTSIINQFLPEPQAGLLSGILLGTRATLSPELKDALITTGTLHIIALSGSNITMLTKIISIVFLSFVSRKIAGLLSIGAIIGFVLFVGPSPSVVRAAIMGCVTLVGVITSKNRTGIMTWGVAVAIMLLFMPALIVDLSFQLSALASLGIVLFDHSSQSQETRIMKPSSLLVFCLVPLATFLKSELRSTLSAQVFTIPLMFITFYRISIISPISNILIGWSIPFIMVFGFMMILFGVVWYPLGQIFSWIVWVFLTYVLRVIDLTARIPHSSIGL